MILDDAVAAVPIVETEEVDFLAELLDADYKARLKPKEETVPLVRDYDPRHKIASLLQKEGFNYDFDQFNSDLLTRILACTVLARTDLDLYEDWFEHAEQLAPADAVGIMLTAELFQSKKLAVAPQPEETVQSYIRNLSVRFGQRVTNLLSRAATVLPPIVPIPTVPTPTMVVPTVSAANPVLPETATAALDRVVVMDGTTTVAILDQTEIALPAEVREPYQDQFLFSGFKPETVITAQAIYSLLSPEFDPRLKSVKEMPELRQLVFLNQLAVQIPSAGTIAAKDQALAGPGDLDSLVQKSMLAVALAERPEMSLTVLDETFDRYHRFLSERSALGQSVTEKISKINGFTTNYLGLAQTFLEQLTSKTGLCLERIRLPSYASDQNSYEDFKRRILNFEFDLYEAVPDAKKDDFVNGQMVRTFKASHGDRYARRETSTRQVPIGTVGIMDDGYFKHDDYYHIGFDDLQLLRKVAALQPLVEQLKVLNMKPGAEGRGYYFYGGDTGYVPIGSIGQVVNKTETRIRAQFPFRRDSWSLHPEEVELLPVDPEQQKIHEQKKETVHQDLTAIFAEVESTLTARRNERKQLLTESIADLRAGGISDGFIEILMRYYLDPSVLEEIKSQGLIPSVNFFNTFNTASKTINYEFFAKNLTQKITASLGVYPAVSSFPNNLSAYQDYKRELLERVLMGFRSTNKKLSGAKDRLIENEPLIFRTGLGSDYSGTVWRYAGPCGYHDWKIHINNLTNTGDHQCFDASYLTRAEPAFEVPLVSLRYYAKGARVKLKEGTDLPPNVGPETIGIIMKDYEMEVLSEQRPINFGNDVIQNYARNQLVVVDPASYLSGRKLRKYQRQLAEFEKTKQTVAAQLEGWVVEIESDSLTRYPQLLEQAVAGFEDLISLGYNTEKVVQLFRNNLYDLSFLQERGLIES